MTLPRVAVVGLGVLGSAAAYHLARRSTPVVGFEQFSLGHSRGASHDTSRIVRRTYERAEYVRLAGSAYHDWRLLGDAVGEDLLTITGGVTLLPSGDAGPYIESLNSCGLRFEMLSGTELRARWPQFDLEDDMAAIVQDETGLVHAARTTTVLQILARQHGAVLRPHCPVVALEPDDTGVTVHAASGAERVDAVIVCADAWTNSLLEPLGISLPLSSTLEQVSYFQPAEPRRFEPGRFPVWIWDSDPCFYGFPCYGEPTIKAARDCSGVPLDVSRPASVPIPERRAELTGFLLRLLHQPGPHVRTVTCQYTLTPDRDFLLGPLPGFPRVQVAVGCGHAFKFAPTIGRVLADLAVSGRTDEDITLFSPSRFPVGRDGR